MTQRRRAPHVPTRFAPRRAAKSGQQCCRASARRARPAQRTVGAVARIGSGRRGWAGRGACISLWSAAWPAARQQAGGCVAGGGGAACRRAPFGGGADWCRAMQARAGIHRLVCVVCVSFSLPPPFLVCVVCASISAAQVGRGGGEVRGGGDGLRGGRRHGPGPARRPVRAGRGRSGAAKGRRSGKRKAEGQARGSLGGIETRRRRRRQRGAVMGAAGGRSRGLT